MVDISCNVEGSQGPSKRTSKKKEEIDRKFPCSVCGRRYGSKGVLYSHTKKKHGS